MLEWLCNIPEKIYIPIIVLLSGACGIMVEHWVKFIVKIIKEWRKEPEIQSPAFGRSLSIARSGILKVKAFTKFSPTSSDLCAKCRIS